MIICPICEVENVSESWVDSNLSPTGRKLSRKSLSVVCALARRAYGNGRATVRPRGLLHFGVSGIVLPGLLRCVGVWGVPKRASAPTLLCEPKSNLASSRALGLLRRLPVAKVLHQALVLVLVVGVIPSIPARPGIDGRALTRELIMSELIMCLLWYGTRQGMNGVVMSDVLVVGCKWPPRSDK